MTAVLYRFDEQDSRTATVMSWAVLLPVAGSMLIPVGLIAVHFDEVLVLLHNNPIAMAQIALGLIIWAALFIVPVLRRLMRAGLKRHVEIATGRVHETTQTLFGRVETDLPLKSFAGVVHRVRTSVDGLSHQLALVERESGREIVFSQAPTIARDAIDHAVRTLGIPELKASDLSNTIGRRNAEIDLNGRLAA